MQLKSKPTKAADNKYRGEIEVKVTFHCHSRVDFASGLKKRSSSIRNLATAVGKLDTMSQLCVGIIYCLVKSN